MNTMRYQELPTALRSKVEANDFLSACSTNDSDRIVLWIINPELEKQEEFEYSISENRFLSLKERKSAIRSAKKTVLSKMGVEVSIENYLEEGTNVLYEVYKIFSIESNENIAEASQIYFTYYKSTLEEIVKNALDGFEFTKMYEKWSRIQRINYWVEVLYRLRRQAGESGIHEDDIFDESLVEQMKQVDPNIINLIQSCLSQLAKIEQINEYTLINVFELKTGCSLA